VDYFTTLPLPWQFLHAAIFLRPATEPVCPLQAGHLMLFVASWAS